jgi:hypothetical protein
MPRRYQLPGEAFMSAIVIVLASLSAAALVVLIIAAVDDHKCRQQIAD